MVSSWLLMCCFLAPIMQTPDLALGFLKTWPSFIRRIVIAALLQRLDGDFKNNYAGRGAGAACPGGGGCWGRPAVYSREIPAGFPGCTGIRPMKRRKTKVRGMSELLPRTFVFLLFAPPTGATRLYTPSDSHQLLLLLLCLLLWPTRQVIDLCAYRL